MNLKFGIVIVCLFSFWNLKVYTRYVLEINSNFNFFFFYLIFRTLDLHRFRVLAISINIRVLLLYSLHSNVLGKLFPRVVSYSLCLATLDRELYFTQVQIFSLINTSTLIWRRILRTLCDRLHLEQWAKWRKTKVTFDFLSSSFEMKWAIGGFSRNYISSRK